MSKRSCDYYAHTTEAGQRFLPNKKATHCHLLFGNDVVYWYYNKSWYGLSLVATRN